MRIAPLLCLLLAGCSAIPFIGRPAREVWGFTVPWDARSGASAVANARALDVVVTSWITLDSVSGQPSPLLSDTATARLPSGTRTMAVVTTFGGETFHQEPIRYLAADSAALARTAGGIARLVRAAGHRGLVLDFEGLGARDLAALIRVASAIRDSAHARGIRPVAIAAPAGDTAGYPGRYLLGAADLVLVMLYDEHWPSSPPGAIASPDWVRRQLGVRLAEVGASRIVASLPLFGYVWSAGGGATVVGYDDAHRLAARDGVVLTREPSSATLRGSLAGAWETWVSDAELLATLMRDVHESGVRHVALWRLGLEDPAVWTRAVRVAYRRPAANARVPAAPGGRRLVTK